MADSGVKIKLLIENSEGDYVVTAMDDVGSIGRVESWDKEEAIRRARAATHRRLGTGDIQFIENDLTVEDDDLTRDIGPDNDDGIDTWEDVDDE